jgi:1-acyl-sn-glycerol-3-phosphate acyltransferase
MHVLKLTIFSIYTLLTIIIYLPILVVLYPIRRSIGAMLLQFYSSINLHIFRVVIEHADPIDRPRDKKEGIILLPNHVSLLDIFILSSLYRTIYTAKIEVQHYPLVGQIAWLIGIIFLKRDSPEDRHRVIRSIAHNTPGRILTIFAQGTTSRIDERLPFKCGIFKTVEIDPSIVLFPVTIRYKEDREIAWTKNQILMDNLKSICGSKRIHVKVTIHPRISIDDYHGKTITDICTTAQERVLSALQTDY